MDELDQVITETGKWAHLAELGADTTVCGDSVAAPVPMDLRLPLAGTTCVNCRRPAHSKGMILWGESIGPVGSSEKARPITESERRSILSRHANAEPRSADPKIAKSEPSPSVVPSGSGLDSFEQSASDAELIQEFVRPRGDGQAFLRDANLRRAVERHAMDRARAHYEGQTPPWQCEDVSTKRSYDFHLTRGGEERLVEVKGTTSNGNSIILTRLEVELAQQSTNMELVVISSIDVGAEVEGTPTTSGGRLRVFKKWQPTSDRLSPIAFTYQLD